MRDRTPRAAVVLAVLLLLAAPVLNAQRVRRGGFRQPVNVDVSGIDFEEFNVPYDGRFTFVRLRFTPDYVGRGGSGSFLRGIDFQWDHDYPRAERHFTKILSELTALNTVTEGHNILAVDDPELMKYPVAYMAEPGHWTMTEAALRKTVVPTRSN